jgi:hypothetical protein
VADRRAQPGGLGDVGNGHAGGPGRCREAITSG